MREFVSAIAQPSGDPAVIGSNNGKCDVVLRFKEPLLGETAVIFATGMNRVYANLLASTLSVVGKYLNFGPYFADPDIYKCPLCKAVVAKDDAVYAGWTPNFWVGDRSVDHPLCAICTKQCTDCNFDNDGPNLLPGLEALLGDGRPVRAVLTAGQTIDGFPYGAGPVLVSEIRKGTARIDYISGPSRAAWVGRDCIKFNS